MGDPIPPLLDDAIDAMTLDSDRKRLVGKLTLKSVLKYLCLVLPALPAWIGLGSTPILAQARPVEVQPFTTLDRQGNAETEMGEYTESDMSAGSSPTFIQPVTGSLVAVGELVAVKLTKPENREGPDGTGTGFDRS